MSASKPGLRERKKQQTREAIQDHALRLYQEQGYATTTVEQIADAANVSVSTFFRYFPTKPETVLYDRLDPVFVSAFIAQPSALAPVPALRAAMTQVFSELGDDQRQLELTRMRLIAEVPELRAAAAHQVERAIPLFTDGVAQRVGRDPQDVEVHLWVGALVGVVLTAFFRAVAEGADVVAACDSAVAYVEAGLPL